MLDAYRYVMQHPVMVAEWITDHLCISLIAIAIGTVLGVTTGIFIAGKGRERTADVVLYFAEIMMTVPSLALFGLLMLLLSRMGLSAIGFLPAVITLVIYSQLPILRNTYTAIRQVDQTMIDAGRGMGMSESQLLLRIKLPLALPIIMAGLRNAMVLTIGIAAIAALIGAGGLGVPIFRGLRNARMDLIVIGGISVSILALLIDGLMALLERWVMPKGLRS
ncbi:MAG: ABC transporter permease [Deltaproteobacteria bacterium]|nr:ABC transporter permease [Deltaproteobacteria bacterium]MDL1961777.1 ABC transporter permease [Deltaproteobacteria bacterium]